MNNSAVHYTSTSGLRLSKLLSVLSEQRPGVVFPKLGLAATIIGTTVAATSVPPNVQEPGVLAYPASVLIICLLLAPLTAAIKDLRSVVRVENVLASAPIYWLLLDLVQGRWGITMANRDEVSISFVACGLFSIGTWVAAMHRPWGLPRFVVELSRRELTASKAFSIGILCFCFGVFPFLFFSNFDLDAVLEGLRANRSGAAWSRKSGEGGWGAFIEHLAYFGMLLPSLAVVVGRSVGWINPATVLTWFLSFTYAVFQAQGGNRRYIGVMFGAAVVVWLMTEKKPRWHHSIVVAGSAALLLFLMQFMLHYRHEGIELIAELEEEETLVDLSEISVDDNFLRLAQTVHLVPAIHPYVWHEYMLFALIRPIPRALWPSKPLAPSFRVQDYVDIGASLSSSAVGEFYASGGLFATLFGGWLYGRLGSMGQGLLSPPRTMPRTILYGGWLMALFAGCRSMQDLVMMSYVVLALIAILWLARNWLEPAPDPALQILNLLRTRQAEPRLDPAVFPSKTHIGDMARPATMPRRRPREDE